MRQRKRRRSAVRVCYKQDVSPQGSLCVYCGALAHSVDHVPAIRWAEALGTAHFDRLLLVRSCGPCNAALGDKPLHTLAERQAYLRRQRRQRL